MGMLWGFLSARGIDAGRLRALLEEDSCGAVCVFEGRVRDHNGQGRPRVARLAYESYRPLAERLLFGLLDEASRRFGLASALVVHRVGELKVGELAVWIGVASPHRAEAFAGCRWLIDEVKLRLPVWKRETYENGECAWIEGCEVPGHAHAH